MKVIRFAWQLLETRDRITIVTLTFIRALLALMDVAALYLLGFTVSLLANGTPAAGTALSEMYLWLNQIFPFNTYAVLAAAALVLFTTKSALSLVLNLTMNAFLVKVESKKANQLFEKMSVAQLESLNKWDSHEINYAINSGVGAIFRQILNAVSSFYVESLLLLVICIFLISTNWLAFICMGLFFGLLGLVMVRALGSKSEKYARLAKQDSITTSRLIQEYVQNPRVIRAPEALGRLNGAFQRSRSRLAKANGELELATTLPRYITEIGLMVALALLFLARSLGPESLTQIQDVTIFVAAGFRIIGSLLPLQGIINTLRKSSQDGQATIDILNEFNEAKPSQKATYSSDGNQSLNFSSLVYEYSSDSARLSYGSHSLPSRGLVALVGESGVGKSTLADLLLGIRRPSSGRVTYLGRPIDGANAEFTEKVAYVPQRIGIFSGTLRDNLTLAFGQPTTHPDVALRQVLYELGLGGWFEELPHGLESELLGSNLSLSGGQLQRLGLARALLQKPTVLILDEVTSALDRTTQALIDEILIQLSRTICVFSITHRPEILAHADEIWEMTREGLLVRPSDGSGKPNT